MLGQENLEEILRSGGYVDSYLSGKSQLLSILSGPSRKGLDFQGEIFLF